MRTPRIKIYDNKGNSFSMRGFKKAVKQDTLKDAIPKSLITGQGILTGGQIKKFIADGSLREVNFDGQVYFNKLEVAKCLNAARGINFKLTKISPEHSGRSNVTGENRSDGNIRYSNKKIVSQKQMDEALNAGIMCLETWEVARPISFSLKLQKAINLAALKHKDQKRKSDGLPYVVHPFSVMLILSQYTDNEDILVAALLHDVLEDTDYTAQELEQDFGPKVLKIVSEVTEPKKAADGSKLPWRTSKDAYFAGLKKAGSEALMVAAADKIHNMSSIAKAYLEQGDPLWLKFSSPKEQQLWFYEQSFNIISSKSNHPLVKDLEQALQYFKLKVI